MKTHRQTLLALVVPALFLTACATAQTSRPPVGIAEQTRALAAAPTPAPAAIPVAYTATQGVVSTIPEWYMNQPESTTEVIYVGGTAFSRDMSMSTHKAQLDAETHLANKIAGEINTLTKDYKRDLGDEFVQQSEIVANKIATDVKVIGGHVAKRVILSEGNGFRTYVLVKFPLGSANTLLTNFINKNTHKAAKAAAEAELEQHKLDRRNRDEADAAVTPTPVLVAPKPAAEKVTLSPAPTSVIVNPVVVNEVSPLGLNDKAEEN
jgi:hypothetical protein